jgi:hypothetical protein
MLVIVQGFTRTSERVSHEAARQHTEAALRKERLQKALGKP